MHVFLYNTCIFLSYSQDHFLYLCFIKPGPVTDHGKKINVIKSHSHVPISFCYTYVGTTDLSLCVDIIVSFDILIVQS